MNLAEKILHLAQTTDMDNAQIARALGCSKRHVRRVAGSWRQRIQCKLEVPETVPTDTPSTAKILLFDIETSPMEVFVWSFWQKYISTDNVIKDWAVLSWSAKWLFDSTVMSMRVTPEEAQAREDSSLIRPLWDLMNEADIVVAHNGDKFDIKKINARFIINGLTPPMPYRTIDTKKVASRVFGFSSNKLDYLNKMFKLPQKIETDFQLWIDCVAGKEAALREMEEYNRHDVVALEELYLYLRPWIKSHPNVNLYLDETTVTACTNCGNTGLTWGGHYYTPAGKYEAFRCDRCGAIGRSRTCALTKEQRAVLPIAAAR